MRLDAFTQNNPLILGSFDVIRGDILHGWIVGATPEVRPLVFVNDTPAVLLDDAIPRPDVCRDLGIANAHAAGFACRLPASSGDAVLSLYGVTPDGVFHITRRPLNHAIYERALGIQIRRAAAAAAAQDAVGIVCWDGAHNPIGRAKVLYDIVTAGKRPAVLLCYLHEEFGGSVWPPLQQCDLPLIAIPWNRRHEGHALLRRHGVSFNTVWICKPRLPSFRLAAAVSHPSTRFILDIDDNEEAFSAFQKDSRAEYDAPGSQLAHFLLEQISSRTVVSPPLQRRFGGRIIRHVRRPDPRPRPDDNTAYRIGFVGTVRPHKQVLPLARALRIISATTHLPLELHVYGDIQPPEYREALKDTGVVLRDTVPLGELPEALAAMHVLISGFPAPDTDERTQAIVQCQVPAKISDALAAARPILVPDTPAVDDLRDIPGVYLFTKDNFTEQLVAALSEKRTFSLPSEFTPEGAYETFSRVEKKARTASALCALTATFSAVDMEPDTPTLVLLWKQHDAGLYGRRVDQIARSYKRRYPNHRVIILEFLAAQTESSLQTSQQIDGAFQLLPPVPPPPLEEDFGDEKAVKEMLLALKCRGLKRDGILLQTLRHSSPQNLRETLSSFLERERLSPDSTLFILFPIIDALEDVEEILRPYTRLIDVVDNQLSWADNNIRRCRLLDQYFRLLAPASRVVFNTEQTRAFFADRHFLNGAAAEVIPNWYTLPDGICPEPHPIPGTTRHIFYSGNMNDRLDWSLLHAIAAQPDVCLHLAGTAQRAREKLNQLIAQGVVYHGVTPERETLTLLSLMDAAIVPHILDRISMYMNPIKIGMYSAVGIPVVCPAALKIDRGNILEYSNKYSCLKIISTLPKRSAGIPQQDADASENAYLRLLEHCHPALAAQRSFQPAG